jgi:DNA adenine methylase
VKWVGSKQRLAALLSSQVWAALKPGGVYYEPFAGSLAVYHRLRAHGWRGPALLSDILGPLISCYRALAESPREVAAALAAHQSALSEADYYETRRLFNQATATARGEASTQAARFLYLNARSFNALWRTNKKGEMSAPFGGDSGRPLPEAARVFAAAASLQGAALHCCDFSVSIDTAGPGDAIYADPPYEGSFQSYAGVFDTGEQVRLRDKLRAAYQRGAAVFASNLDTPIVRELYGAPFRLKPLSLHHQVGGRATRRHDAQELLISAIP